MALSIGIVGLPNVGKSTLFNALTDGEALAANYPFATIEPNTGVVPIPDRRLAKLAELYKTDKIIPASVQFVDIAGLVAGAHQGEGLGNQFLAHIRSTAAICHVVRAFADPNVTAAGSSSPAKDIEIIGAELALADLQTVDKRLPQLAKEARADLKLKPQLASLTEVKTLLAAGKPLSEINPDHIADLFLLSAKPVIYVFNVDEAGLKGRTLKLKGTTLREVVAPAEALFICAKLESELRGLDAAERAELLASYSQTSSGLEQLVQAAYGALGLQSFLTAGEKEVRAWTIAAGTTAPAAAGVIHSDFEKGFIAAQVVDYDDLVKAGSLAAARAAGKVQTCGRDYQLQPNDVVEFRFNI